MNNAVFIEFINVKNISLMDDFFSTAAVTAYLTFSN